MMDLPLVGELAAKHDQLEAVLATEPDEAMREARKRGYAMSEEGAGVLLGHGLLRRLTGVLADLHDSGHFEAEQAAMADWQDKEGLVIAYERVRAAGDLYHRNSPIPYQPFETEYVVNVGGAELQVGGLGGLAVTARLREGSAEYAVDASDFHRSMVTYEAGMSRHAITRAMYGGEVLTTSRQTNLDGETVESSTQDREIGALILNRVAEVIEPFAYERAQYQITVSKGLAQAATTEGITAGETVRLIDRDPEIQAIVTNLGTAQSVAEGIAALKAAGFRITNLAKMFGVSTESVRQWTQGGNMRQAHLMSLNNLKGAMRQLIIEHDMEPVAAIQLIDDAGGPLLLDLLNKLDHGARLKEEALAHFDRVVGHMTRSKTA